MRVFAIAIDFYPQMLHQVRKGENIKGLARTFLALLEALKTQSFFALCLRLDLHS